MTTTTMKMMRWRVVFTSVMMILLQLTRHGLVHSFHIAPLRWRILQTTTTKPTTPHVPVTTFNSHDSRIVSSLFSSSQQPSEQQQQQQQQHGEKEVEEPQQPDEWVGFNPLANTGGASKARILMRQSQMQEFTQELMLLIQNRDNNADNHHAVSMKINALLQQSKSFLLEPLENDHAVLDHTSIYEPGMNRTQRYQRYKQIMDERIAKASQQHLKTLLTTMKEFVMQHEHSSSQ